MNLRKQISAAKIIDEVISSSGKNISKITYDSKKDKWVIQYRNGIREDNFDNLDDLIVFLDIEDSQ